MSTYCQFFAVFTGVWNWRNSHPRCSFTFYISNLGILANYYFFKNPFRYVLVIEVPTWLWVVTGSNRTNCVQTNGWCWMLNVILQYLKPFNCVQKRVSARLKMLSTKCVYKTYKYLICMYRQNLTLYKLQLLICHKSKAKQTKPNNILMSFSVIVIAVVEILQPQKNLCMRRIGNICVSSIYFYHYNWWLIDFNCMLNHLGLFYAYNFQVESIIFWYLHIMCSFFLKLF